MSTNSFVMPNDMSDLCRVCLQLPEESQYLDLTTIYDEEDNLTYGECFTICTQIDLNAGEGLPHHLCKSCGLELQMSYDFHKKIGESGQVIEQFQRQIKVQKANVTELTPITEESKNSNLVGEKKNPLAQLINEKYVIIEEQEQLPQPSKKAIESCMIQRETEQGLVATLNVIDETDEIDVLNNICPMEDNIHLPSHKSITSIETVSENDIRIDGEDHLEVEDYQNLETLEDEETETLQIKCGENTIPIHVTKFKTLESGDNEVFVEYAEDYNEEEERDEIDEEFIQETKEEAAETHLRWQENVVAVANEEHLPIEIENVEEEEKEVSIYESSKINENQVTINESSQDEAIENYEEEEEEANEETHTQIAKRKSNNTNINNSYNNNNDNNSTGRKRHVGSYSCDYCHRVYPNYSRMKTHRRCHESDRPKFSCSHCGRIYATKQARDCHIQTAHDKFGYTCSICSKVFAIRKSLEIHVRYHTGDFPYACKLCDRKFAQACHLNTHINVKHNKIRFSCEYPNCGKFFTSSSSLRNHEYTHGVMPFECEYCQQGYPAKSKLRVHIQRKHDVDISDEQLERMRKFHIMRSKVNLVQFIDT